MQRKEENSGRTLHHVQDCYILISHVMSVEGTAIQGLGSTTTLADDQEHDALLCLVRQTDVYLPIT